MNTIDYYTDPSLSCVVVQASSLDDGEQTSGVPLFDMDVIRQGLLQAVGQHHDKQQMLAAVARLIGEHLRPEATVYYDRDASQALDAGIYLRGDPSLTDAAEDALLFALAESACEESRLVVEELRGQPPLVAACLPVQLPGRPAHAIMVVFSDTCVSHDLRLNVLEVITAYITLWHVHRSAVVAEHEAQLTAALQELLEEAENCADLRRACHVLAERLQEYLGCDRVALATCSRWNGRSCLRAISGVDKFDKHTPLVGALEAALDEAILRETLTVWPPESAAGRHAALAHHKLCSVADVSCVVSSPLRNSQGELIGAWLFLGAKQRLSRPHVTRMLQASEARVASCLALLGRVRRGLLASFLSRLTGKDRSWKTRGALLGLCTLLVALLLPVQYRIGCDCRVEPVTRRYVAAPYDGILERALVTAGATVAPGDVLALMDGREIRWELAGIIAERDRAVKQSEASFAQHDFAAANVARLEVDRLELKKELFEARQENLEVKSPIAGMVVFGDLERAQGAPVTCGQTLFEIAPLAEMIAELAVPEGDIPYVREGQEVILHLEACRESPLRATIKRIHPRSQIRDQRNVFLAEVTLPNEDGQLRPGMQGSARVVGPRRTVAWTLFHKPWETLCRWLGW